MDAKSLRARGPAAAAAAAPQGHDKAALASGDTAACPALGASNVDAAPWRASNGGKVPKSLLLVVVLDMTAVGLVIPMLSVYSKMLGGGHAFTGVLQSVYGFTQLVGAGWLGALSDTHGRKRVMQLSSLGALVGYSLLFTAIKLRSLPLLFVSRIPIGLFKQTMTVSRACVCDCVAPVGRFRAMGMLGAACGTGFIFGPASGGIIAAKHAKSTPPLLAAGLFVVCFLLVTFVLPETAIVDKVDAKEEAAHSRVSNQCRKSWRVGTLLYRRSPKAVPLLAIKALVDFSVIMVHSTFAAFVQAMFDLDMRGVGMMMAFSGVVSVLVDMMLIPMVLKLKLPTHVMAKSGVCCLALSLAAMAMVAKDAKSEFRLALALMGTGTALSRSALNAMISDLARREESGSVSGAMDAVQSICRITAPLLAGVLQQYGALAAPAIVGTLCCLAAAASLHVMTAGVTPEITSAPSVIDAKSKKTS